MKKSEITQLTQIIEHLVAKEVRKQLPSIIAETFQNMMGKTIVTEQRQPIQEVAEVAEEAEPQNFRTSLKEMFAGATPTKAPQAKTTPSAPPLRQFTKNPVLNQILNETTPDLRNRERLVGAAAFQGGYSPSMAMMPGFNAPTATPSGAELDAAMAAGEPEFAKNMPVMAGAGHVASIPMGRAPVLREGQESTHAPLSALPEGVSALDVRHAAPPAVAQALTKNYSQMMKLIDKKRKGVLA